MHHVSYTTCCDARLSHTVLKDGQGEIAEVLCQLHSDGSGIECFDDSGQDNAHMLHDRLLSSAVS